MLAFMTLKPNTCQAVTSRTRPLAGRTNEPTAERSFAVGFCERASMPPTFRILRQNNKSRAGSLRDCPGPWRCTLDPCTQQCPPRTTGAATAPLGDRSSGLPDRPCAAPSHRQAGSGAVQRRSSPVTAAGPRRLCTVFPRGPLRASPRPILAADAGERQHCAGIGDRKARNAPPLLSVRPIAVPLAALRAARLSPPVTAPEPHRRASRGSPTPNPHPAP